jgi:hypothetical protein
MQTIVLEVLSETRWVMMGLSENRVPPQISSNPMVLMFISPIKITILGYTGYSPFSDRPIIKMDMENHGNSI